MPVVSPDFFLRPVRPGDETLLSEIYASTRAEELAIVPWSDAEKAAFCQMQHRAQDVHYRNHYPTADFLLIGSPAGGVVGRLYVDRWENEIRIMDLALLPAHRGCGIGTRILTDLIAEASASGKMLSIHVERQNPALRLYLRLGFQEAGENGFHLLLRLPPCGDTLRQ